MKNNEEKVIEILTKTESELREAIVEAAQAGDYRSVDMARLAAVNIKNLRTQILNPEIRAEIRPARRGTRTLKKVSTKKRKKSDYPQFKIKKDILIRIGWSKKQRREYTHKAPKLVFEQTVKAMVILAQNGSGPFLAEQIIEHANNNESEIIPSYQVYLVIGFLRKAECIKQVGRDGYDIPTEIVEKAEEKWVELSNKRK